MTSLRDALAVASIARAIALDVPGEWRMTPSTGNASGMAQAPRIEDTELADVTLKLFADGHYALAVEQAYKCVDRRVSAKARLSGMGQTGQDLMFSVFSPDKPRLRLNDLHSVEDRDEQDGFKFIFGGCMRAIRNPRAHNHLFVDE